MPKAEEKRFRRRDMKYSCPFCGTKCDRIRVPVMLDSEYVEYRCTNRSCGAIMSFDNMAFSLNPKITDRWFLNRYLGGDSE